MKFSDKVYKLTAKIPRGKISTYSDIAQALGNKMAARAVGNALNKNQDTKSVPCHRVIKSNGEVGGYAYGRNKKTEKLKVEGVKIKKGKVINFHKYLYRF